MDKDRRKSLRTPSNLALELYDLKGRMVVGEGRFVNMSEKGAQMESRKPLRKRSTVRLHVVSGKATPLQLAGRVVWLKRKSNGFTYGIQFLRTSLTSAYN